MKTDDSSSSGRQRPTHVNPVLRTASPILHTLLSPIPNHSPLRTGKPPNHFRRTPRHHASCPSRIVALIPSPIQLPFRPSAIRIACRVEADGKRYCRREKCVLGFGSAWRVQLHGNEAICFYDFGDVLSQQLWRGRTAVKVGGGDECNPDEYNRSSGSGIEPGGGGGVDQGVGDAGRVGDGG